MPSLPSKAFDKYLALCSKPPSVLLHRWHCGQSPSCHLLCSYSGQSLFMCSPGSPMPPHQSPCSDPFQSRSQADLSKVSTHSNGMMPMRGAGQGRPTSQGEGVELQLCRLALAYDPSTPPGTESCTDVPCSAPTSPSEQLNKEVTGHFYRTGRHHSVTGPLGCLPHSFPPALASGTE